MWWLVLLWLAQPISAEAGTPVSVMLSAGAGPTDVIYTAAPGEVVTVTARSNAEEPIDVTLEILRENERIAFNDDHRTNLELLAPLDSAISGLLLEETGSYTLRIHSFSGAQSGEVEVLVQSEPLIQPCVTPAQAVELAAHQPFVCLLDLQAGQTVALTARDTSSTLDPVLALLDADDVLLAQNDDHNSDDLLLNVLDARIAKYEISTTGTYTVRVSDFGGAAGALDLRIEIES